MASESDIKETPANTARDSAMTDKEGLPMPADLAELVERTSILIAHSDGSIPPMLMKKDKLDDLYMRACRALGYDVDEPESFVDDPDTYGELYDEVGGGDRGETLLEPNSRHDEFVKDFYDGNNSETVICATRDDRLGGLGQDEADYGLYRVTREDVARAYIDRCDDVKEGETVLVKEQETFQHVVDYVIKAVKHLREIGEY